jgi:hypothetical protein
VYIDKDPGSVTVTFDDAGPVFTYFAQRPADWAPQSDHRR